MYFDRFPKGSYILPGTTTYKQVVDLFRRIKIKDKIKNEASLYSEYFVTIKVWTMGQNFEYVCVMEIKKEGVGLERVSITNRYPECPCE